MSVQKGAAVLWGTGSVTATAAATAGGAATLGVGVVQSVSFNPTAKKTEVTGADGATVTEIFSNHMENITLEIVATATSGTNTLANAVTQTNLTPKPGDDLTVVDTSDTEIASAGGASAPSYYIIDSATKTRTVDNVPRWTVNAHRYIAGHLATVT